MCVLYGVCIVCVLCVYCIVCVLCVYCGVCDVFKYTGREQEMTAFVVGLKPYRKKEQ